MSLASISSPPSSSLGALSGPDIWIGNRCLGDRSFAPQPLFILGDQLPVLDADVLGFRTKALGHRRRRQIGESWIRDVLFDQPVGDDLAFFLFGRHGGFSKEKARAAEPAGENVIGSRG